MAVLWSRLRAKSLDLCLRKRKCVRNVKPSEVQLWLATLISGSLLSPFSINPLGKRGLFPFFLVSWTIWCTFVSRSNRFSPLLNPGLASSYYLWHTTGSSSTGSRVLTKIARKHPCTCSFVSQYSRPHILFPIHFPSMVLKYWRLKMGGPKKCRSAPFAKLLLTDNITNMVTIVTFFNLCFFLSWNALTPTTRCGTLSKSFPRLKSVAIFFLVSQVCQILDPRRARWTIKARYLFKSFNWILSIPFCAYLWETWERSNLFSISAPRSPSQKLVLINFASGRHQTLAKHSQFWGSKHTRLISMTWSILNFPRETSVRRLRPWKTVQTSRIWFGII